uniref:Large ribosomal subunit protein bL34m n=1 Tax=Blastobotrys adeninivorans TaxID=409370 RepID=A0A060T473_BLAAD
MQNSILSSSYSTLFITKSQMFSLLRARVCRAPIRPVSSALSRGLCSFSNPSPFTSIRRPVPTTGSSASITAMEPSFSSVFNGLTPFSATQRRWKARGNTYQPTTLKRKRRIGFLARARSRQGRRILARRRQKGRWYLSH